MVVKCSTNLVIKGQNYGRTCGKYLGDFILLVGNLYCKSCKQSNYYEIVTEEGLKKARQL